MARIASHSSGWWEISFLELCCRDCDASGCRGSGVEAMVAVEAVRAWAGGLLIVFFFLVVVLCCVLLCCAEMRGAFDGEEKKAREPGNWGCLSSVGQ